MTLDIERPSSLRLSELETGCPARIVQVSTDSVLRRRLMEMGLTRGESLVVEKVAPLGDPMEIVVRGYHLSLRREESACITVQRER